jgi:hypothetical protein
LIYVEEEGRRGGRMEGGQEEKLVVRVQSSVVALGLPVWSLVMIPISPLSLEVNRGWRDEIGILFSSHKL